MITAGAFTLAASIGALVRWQIGVRLPRPMGTLVVNLAGAFALGLIVSWAPPGATVIGVAGIGATTTFSTLVADLVDLWEHNRIDALAYGLTTIVAGIGAAALGIAIAA